MKYEQLIKTIFIEMSFIDIICIAANLHLSLKHPEEMSWATIYSKEFGRRMLKILIDFEIGLPDEIIKEFKKEFENEITGKETINNGL